MALREFNKIIIMMMMMIILIIASERKRKQQSASFKHIFKDNSPKSKPGPKKSVIWSSTQVESPAGQETFHSHLPKGPGPQAIAHQLNC